MPESKARRGGIASPIATSRNAALGHERYLPLSVKSMRDGYILRTFADELQTPSLAIV